MNDMEIDYEINYEKLEEAIAGDNTALAKAFNWDETPQGDCYWREQNRGRTELDVEALKSMRKTPSIQVGKTYTDESGTERECIFIEGNRAYMRRKCSYTAYVWDVNTGNPISPEIIPRIDLTPKPVKKTVELGYSSEFGPEIIVDGTSTHSITFSTIDGEPDTASIKMEKLNDS